jgi:spore maturation protein CgeB
VPFIYLGQPKVERGLPLNSEVKRVMLVASTGTLSQLEFSIAGGFKRLGIEVDTFSVNEGLSYLERASYSRARVHGPSRVDFGQKLLNRRFVKKVLESSCDLVLVFESNWFILPETILKIKSRCRAAIALWEMNCHIWNSYQSGCLPLYDAVFSLDSHMLPVYKTAYVKKVFFLPPIGTYEMTEVPEITDEDREVYSSDLAFVGQVYPERAAVFEELTEYDFNIYGPVCDYEPRRCEPSNALKIKIKSNRIGHAERKKVYNLSKIVLNIEALDLHINSTSIRPFEVALCRGFPLVEYKKDLEGLFDVGREIVCFHDTEDLKEKIDYYLEHNNERMEVSNRCRERILKEHMTEVRLKQMLEYTRLVANK